MYHGRKVYAVVLAAGNGRRMHSKTKKQFLEILGRPLFAWSLGCFDCHPAVDGIVLVTGEEDIDRIQQLTGEEGTYPVRKPLQIVKGGRERYHSVYEGLKAIRAAEGEPPVLSSVDSKDPIVMIHDCARPLLTHSILDDALHAAEKYHAAVVGMPVKDTIKILDADHFVRETPERSAVWLMQTPQSFDFGLIYAAYQRLIRQEESGQLLIPVTDDAMVVEAYTGQRVKVIPGRYENIKVTTPEDVYIAELYLKNQENS